ncbi:Lipopolysaccharide export system ATP-binding protein LptB [bacterium YEK0313]|nr:Lipopolysaccharide export system ATP-binding protein LptB [bacterium YEK0313]
MTPALETRRLVRRFGGLVATNDVSLAVAPGTRHALIGPNGAGKTTLINLVTGVIAPTSGEILLEGADITRLQPHRRVARGLARTFQITQLFNDLTPLETVGLAISEYQGAGTDWWRPTGSRQAVLDEAAEILAAFRLGDVVTTRTATLPYGKRRLLEIATALACRPRVLLLDEPAAGVPESERHEIIDIVSGLPRDVTIVLIEHDMDMVFRFAERITVLVQGAIFTEGTAAEIQADPRVREVYLGEGEA